MKPLYSGHHQNLKSYRGVRYIEVLPKLASFTSKPYFRVLGYSVIEPKVCQNVGVGRNQINAKEPINKVDKNAASLVRTNSHCKREAVAHVQQKFPLLYPYFYPCLIALWRSLQLENTTTTAMNTDCKSLHSHGPEKAM